MAEMDIGTVEEDLGQLRLAPDEPDMEEAHVGVGLASLPFDILRMVAWDEQLEMDDVAALRLTCRSLVDTASTRLFYRIAISKLNKDREAFLAICNNPHLAHYVHEVEWLDIFVDLNLFDRMIEFLPPDQDMGLQEVQSLTQYFREEARAAFWLFNVTAPTPDLDAAELQCTREATVAQFHDTFRAAIDKLPNLHTFGSRPMKSERIINSDDAEYPMTASMFQWHLDAPPFSTTTPQNNDGLFFFLLPAMDRPTSTVRRLRWADEFPRHGHVRSPPPLAFDGLDSLELCLNHPIEADSDLEITSRPWMDEWEAAWKPAMPTLRHLKLCGEHGYPTRLPKDDEDEMLPELGTMLLSRTLLAAPGCVLRSLSLVGVCCGTSRLLTVVRANASTLCDLYFKDVPVKTTLIRKMAQIPDLQLSTMCVLDEDIWDYPDDEEPCHLPVIYEPALMRYLNKISPVEDCNHASCDPMNGYCDRGVRRLAELQPSSRFVTSMRPLIAELDDESVISVDSDDSIECRRRSAPKWAWAKFRRENTDKLSVFYYQVPDSHPGGHITEYWKFTSRDGEVAYGTHPLEFFEEWDPDSGDEEEPTPFCNALRRYFLSDTPPGEDTNEDPDSGNMVMDSEPPEGAMEYDDEDDPIVAWETCLLPQNRDARYYAVDWRDDRNDWD